MSLIVKDDFTNEELESNDSAVVGVSFEIVIHPTGKRFNKHFEWNIARVSPDDNIEDNPRYQQIMVKVNNLFAKLAVERDKLQTDIDALKE